MVGDPATGRLWAGGGSDWTGAGVWRSEDGGANWQLAKLSSGLADEWAVNAPDFTATSGWQAGEPPFGDALQAIWSLHPAPQGLYAGAKPAGLFLSRDGGATWEKNAALADFSEPYTWNPGAAGLTLHTFLGNGDRLWLGISAAGAFASEDGGASWERRNRLSNAGEQSHPDHPAAPCGGDIGRCVHNMQGAGGDLIYQ
ncbi:WD40/YVTN/BNR-like repeat-containing protein [Marimonas arenosa]|uniref:WD40/YVTN/BNR-like repeat-containing protein n=1 Tax=Marimonas arenosa TaxID=1795305 RepID=UPI0027D2868C|nr:hypothetical protein [Marimonas arenosa]